MEKRKLGILLLLLTLVVVSIGPKILKAAADTGTIYVDDDNTTGPWDGTQNHPYQNITSALMSADPKDTIFIRNGTYSEQMNITKSISLQGQNKHGTIIQGNKTGDVIRVTASDVSLAELTIQYSGSDSDSSGVYIYKSDRVTINQSIFQNNTNGISLYSSDDCVLTSNNISGNNIGVRLSGCQNFAFTANDISSNVDMGVYITDSYNVTLQDNSVSGCEFGTGFVGCSRITLVSNDISQNKYGIYLFGSVESILYNNDVYSNTDFGIWISQSNSSVVSGNNMTSNERFGIYVGNSTSITITRNNISTSQQFGIRFDYSDSNLVSQNMILNNHVRGILFFYSNDNAVFLNNFISNAQSLGSAYSTNILDSEGEGNYWSDYQGTDENQDGIADSPHVFDQDNQDNYPLMGPFSEFTLPYQGRTYEFTLISNTNVSRLWFDDAMRTLKFQLASNNVTEFFRICIPDVLVNSPYTVLVDDKQVNATLLPKSNNTHTYLYFAFSSSAHEIGILPRQFYELMGAYTTLLEKYEELNQTYYQLLGNYSSLAQNFTQVSADYTNLRATYDALNQTYTNLLNQYEELLSTYNQRESQYDFMTTALLYTSIFTIAAVLTTSAIALKFLRTSQAQRNLIEKYKAELERISLLDAARNQFETDVQRRKGKIEKFEGKYGIEIRPHDSLDEIIKKLELKRKKED